MASNMDSNRIAGAVLLAMLMLFGTLLCYPQSPDEPAMRARTLDARQTGSINVTVMDELGNVVKSATVKIQGGGISWQNQTQNGTYNFTGLMADDAAPVSYHLNASTNDSSYAEVTTVDTSENATVYCVLTIYGGTIWGSVMAYSGVSLALVAGATLTIVFPESNYTAVTATDGYYQLTGLPAGKHEVLANADGYEEGRLTISLGVGEGRPLPFVLTSKTGWISGHVYHALLGTPLNNSNVSVQVGSLTLTNSTRSDGYYSFERIPDGVYSLTASKDGFFSNTSVDIRVTRGNMTAGADFNLTEKPTSLHGVVRSGTRLLVGANVSVVGTSIFNLSGPDGNYEIGNLTAGTYSVRASSPGYENVTIAGVVILEGGATLLNINLTGLPGALISGVVADAATGLPLANVLVTIVDIDPGRAGVATDINGAYGLPGLDPGNYTIRFEKTGYRPIEISNVNVTKDGQTIQNLEMIPLRNGFEGFIPGFDIPHSMMLMALCLTIVIFALAVYLRNRSFETPESAPAIYDEVDEEEAEKETALGGEEAEDLQEEVNQRTIRKSKNDGD